MSWNYDLAGKRVWVCGHRGMLGSAIVRRLERENCEILAAPRGEVDLRRQEVTEAWMRRERPDVVVVAAALVGGILANAARPADFLYDNLAIALNVLHASWRFDVEKLLYLGSSCVYPRNAPQPIPEEALLTSSLEKTNEAYSIAKIAGIKLAESYARQHGRTFITAMPTNLYGPNDNYAPEVAHVIPALIGKFDVAARAGAPTVQVFGSGKPLREFMYVDDAADACVFLLKHYAAPELINVGTGEEVSIAELAGLVAETVGFKGRIEFDLGKPDGTPRKLVDSAKLTALGWRSQTTLREGLASAYRDYLARPTHALRSTS